MNSLFAYKFDRYLNAVDHYQIIRTLLEIVCASPESSVRRVLAPLIPRVVVLGRHNDSEGSTVKQSNMFIPIYITRICIPVQTGNLDERVNTK